MPSDERHVDESIERREAAVHREAPSRGRAPVGAPDRGQEIGRVRELPRIAFVDPVPGEVRDDDRRDARGRGRRAASGGMSATTSAAPRSLRAAVASTRARVGQCRVEGVRARGSCRARRGAGCRSATHRCRTRRGRTSTGARACGRTAIAAPTSARRSRDPARAAPSALITSIWREAWPKPCPEM